MKIKHLIFLLSFLFSNTLFSQSNSSLDISASLDYGYRSLKGQGGISSLVIGQRDEREVPDLGYRFGINYNRRLSGQLWLRTGLRYAVIKYKEELQDELRWGSEFDPVTGVWTPDPTLPRRQQNFNSFNFFQVPILLRYVLGEGRWQPYAEGGLNLMIFRHLRFREETDLGNTDVEISDPFEANDLQFAFQLAFGSNYTLSEKSSLFAQLAYNRHLSAAAGGPVKEFLYTVGLEIGLRINL